MHASQILRGPSDALDFLVNDWNGSRRKHEFAREICAAAVRRQIPGPPRERRSYTPQLTGEYRLAPRCNYLRGVLAAGEATFVRCTTTFVPAIHPQQTWYAMKKIAMLTAIVLAASVAHGQNGYYIVHAPGSKICRFTEEKPDGKKKIPVGGLYRNMTEANAALEASRKCDRSHSNWSH